MSLLVPTHAMLVAALTLATLARPASLAAQNRKSKPPRDTTTLGGVTPMNCPVGGCNFGGNPPAVTFRKSIWGIIHSGAVIADTVDWCDDTGLSSSSRSVTLNITTALSTTYTTTTGCFGKAYSAFTFTPILGTNRITASINDNAGQTGSASFTFEYDSLLVHVSPDGAQKTKLWSMAVADTFTVENSDTSVVTLALALTCSNAATLACSAPASVTVGGRSSSAVVVSYHTRSYNTVDTVTLRATRPDGHQSDAGSVIESASIAQLAARFDANLQDNQNLGLCANDCFTTVLSHSSASYRTLGTNRSVTLMYHGDRTAIRPYVAADVTFPTGATAPTEVRLQASVSGASQTFVNGETVLHFSTSDWQGGKTYRLAGQLDLRSMATDMYPLQLSVTAVYEDHPETFTYTSKVMVVNQRTAGLLPTVGWSIAGIQQLFPQTDGTMLIVEGDGSGVYFNCTYYGSPCAGPAGDFSTLRSAGTGSALRYTRSYPDSSKLVFDNVGHLIKSMDRWGNADTVTYDANNHISTIGDPILASSFLFAYSTGYFTIELPGPDGAASSTARQTVVTYDGGGHISSFTDADARSTQFTYDAFGRLATLRDRLGDTTYYYYDASSWKLDSIALPAVEIGDQGQMQRPTLRMRAWQRVGVPTASTVAVSAPAPATDTIRALLIGTINDTTSFTADRWGQPLNVVDLARDTTKIVRTGVFATSVTNPLGHTDTYAYTNGRLTSSTPYNQPTTYISYDSWGMPSQIISANSPTVTRSFDAQHRTITTSMAGSYVSTDSLDPRGRVFSSVDAAGHATTKHFDATFGNVDSTHAAAGQWSAVALDGYGRDSILTALGHPQQVRRIYDVLGRDSLLYDGVHAQPVQYTYSALFLTTVRDQKGQVHRTDFNALGWPTVSYDPADTVTWAIKTSYRYDLGGRVASWQNRRGSWITQQWDKLGRMTSQRDTTGTADSVWYSPDGRTIVASNAISIDTLKLGNNGADTVVTGIAGQWFRRVHSATSGANADTTFLTSSLGALQNRINYWDPNRGVLDSVLVGSSSRYRLGYTNELLPDTLAYPGGLYRIDSFTTTHQIYERHYTSSAVETAFNRGYAYDSLGRITTESEPGPTASSTFLRNYTYTGTGAIQEYSETIDSAAPYCDGSYGCGNPHGRVTDTWQRLSFGYDAVDNLTSQVDSLNGNVLTTGLFAAGNRDTLWAATQYTYDADGNRLTRGSTTYTWSALRRLLKVTSGSSTVEYAYNALGELAQRKTNGVVDRHFIWDNGQLVLLLDGSGSRIAEYAYLPDGEPLSYSVGPLAAPTTYFYNADLRGNVVGLNDAVNVDQQMNYGVWGNLETHSGWGLDSTRLGWKGNVWEGGIANLSYVHNRWYDPVSRSFISEDPIGIAGGLNTYAYAKNDPIQGWDPSGLNAANQGGCESLYLYEWMGYAELYWADYPCPAGSTTLDDWAAQHVSTPLPRGQDPSENPSIGPSLPAGEGPQKGVHGLWTYGNWCGAGGRGTPINPTDVACQTHDRCYAQGGFSPTSNFSTEQNAALQGCNQALCNAVRGRRAVLTQGAYARGRTLPFFSRPAPHYQPGEMTEQRVDAEINVYFTQVIAPWGVACH